MNLLKNKISIDMSESFIVAMLLTLAGGYLDVYTYVTRDGVFANAQTGNIVLFGINIAKKNYTMAINYFIPILSFVVGIFLSEIIKHNFRQKFKMHWRQITVLFEIFIIIFVSTLVEPSTNMIANILVSFVCAMQVESFRKVQGSPFASTMCTGNLRSASENLYTYLLTKNRNSLVNFFKYIGIISSFIIGAIVSYKITHVLSVKSILVCCIPLVLAYGLMFIENKKETE